MTSSERAGLARFEGRRVSVALRGGQRIDDSQLVSAGCKRTGILWLFTNGTDRLVAADDVIDLWEAPDPRLTGLTREYG